MTKLEWQFLTETSSTCILMYAGLSLCYLLREKFDTEPASISVLVNVRKQLHTVIFVLYLFYCMFGPAYICGALIFPPQFSFKMNPLLNFSVEWFTTLEPKKTRTPHKECLWRECFSAWYVCVYVCVCVCVWGWGWMWVIRSRKTHSFHMFLWGCDARVPDHENLFLSVSAFPISKPIRHTQYCSTVHH